MFRVAIVRSLKHQHAYQLFSKAIGYHIHIKLSKMVYVASILKIKMVVHQEELTLKKFGAEL